MIMNSPEASASEARCRWPRIALCWPRSAAVDDAGYETTKALNHGTLLSPLVLRALAIKTGLGRPGTARERRDLWEAGGVVVDDLASRVLVLNLPAEGAGLAE